MKVILLILLLISPEWVEAQKYKSTSGSIVFFSEEFLEDITAKNIKVRSIFDSESAQLVFSLPITGFEFKKSLMQEHFNEKFLESEKFPIATFQGTISGYELKRKSNIVWAEGDLEIHGVKQRIKVKGSLDFVGGKVIMHSVFTIKLVDFDIAIPSLMFQKIAEEIEITLDLEYEMYEK